VLIRRPAVAPNLSSLILNTFVSGPFHPVDVGLWSHEIRVGCSRNASVCTLCRYIQTHLASDSQKMLVYIRRYGVTHNLLLSSTLTTRWAVHKLLLNSSLSMAECDCRLVRHSDSILNSRETLATCALIQDGLEGGSPS
jgi:hypothetical protein